MKTEFFPKMLSREGRFENAVYRVYVWTDENGTFRKR